MIDVVKSDEPVEAPVRNPAAYIFWLLFAFTRRVSRGPYVLGLLGSLLVVGALLAIVDALRLDADAAEAATWGVGVVGWWSWFALLIKRLRDLGMGSPWALLLLLPGVHVAVLLGFAFPRSRPASASNDTVGTG